MPASNTTPPETCANQRVVPTKEFMPQLRRIPRFRQICLPFLSDQAQRLRSNRVNIVVNVISLPPYGWPSFRRIASLEVPNDGGAWQGSPPWLSTVWPRAGYGSRGTGITLIGALRCAGGRRIEDGAVRLQAREARFGVSEVVQFDPHPIHDRQVETAEFAILVAIAEVVQTAAGLQCPA